MTYQWRSLCSTAYDALLISVLLLLYSHNNISYMCGSSICLSVCPSISLSYGLLTGKQKGIEKNKMVWIFPMAGLSGVPFLGLMLYSVVYS